MKVYISADLEGVNGVVHSDHLFPSAPGFEQARKWMVQEVNAAIEGALQGGAKEIVVNDSHCQMINLKLHKLHPQATLVSGNQKPMSMMQSLDSSFDAVCFIGYHAKSGTEGALHDHTFTSALIHDVFVNDLSVGEFGLNVGVAAYYGVPVVLVTGDQAVIDEARTLIDSIESVAVKQAVCRRAAHCFPFAKTLEDITLMAKRAIEHLNPKSVCEFKEPYDLRVEFQKSEFADLATGIPGVERQTGYSVTYNTNDYIELYQVFLTMLRVCG